MNTSELKELREELLAQESYEMFHRMLVLQDEFKPLYKKPVSRQTSQWLTGFSNHYSS
jgi:hypothetical protein